MQLDEWKAFHLVGIFHRVPNKKGKHRQQKRWIWCEKFCCIYPGASLPYFQIALVPRGGWLCRWRVDAPSSPLVSLLSATGD